MPIESAQVSAAQDELKPFRPGQLYVGSAGCKSVVFYLLVMSVSNWDITYHYVMVAGNVARSGQDTMSKWKLQHHYPSVRLVSDV